MFTRLKLMIAESWWLILRPFVMALVFILLADLLRDDRDRLRSDGIDGTAIVLQHYVDESGTQGTQVKTGPVEYAYVIQYRFDPPQTDPITEKREVSRGFHGATSVGQTIRVRYLVDDPDVHEIEFGSNNNNIGAAYILAGIFGLAGLGTIWLAWRRAGPLTHLHHRGEKTIATMIFISQDKDRIWGSYIFERGGQRYGGWIKNAHLGKEAGLREGGTITVVFDPENPATNRWNQDIPDHLQPDRG